MKKETISAFIIFCFVCFQAVLSVEASEDNHVLINSYVEAIRADDDAAVKRSIEEIRRQEKVLDLMKIEYREVYKSYVFEEALLRLYEIERKFALLDFQHQSAAQGKTSSKRLFTNSDVAADQGRSSNQDRVRNTSNRDRLRQRGTSIGRAAKRSPNSERRPNSRRSVRRAQR